MSDDRGLESLTPDEMTHEQFILWLAGAVDIAQGPTPEVWAMLRQKLTHQVGSIVKRQMLADKLKAELGNYERRIGGSYAPLVPVTYSTTAAWSPIGAAGGAKIQDDITFKTTYGQLGPGPIKKSS